MAKTFRLRIDRNKLPDLAAETRRRLNSVVRKTAFDIEADAKLRAPVDTGLLRNSIQARMTGELSAEVTVGAEYGIYQELGTVHMPAQPFLGPAVDAVRDEFKAAVQAAVEDAAR